MRHRSPTTAAVTSSPAVVRFSPIAPGSTTRPTRPPTSRGPRRRRRRPPGRVRRGRCGRPARRRRGSRRTWRRVVHGPLGDGRGDGAAVVLDRLDRPDVDRSDVWERWRHGLHRLSCAPIRYTPPAPPGPAATVVVRWTGRDTRHPTSRRSPATRSVTRGSSPPCGQVTRAPSASWSIATTASCSASPASTWRRGRRPRTSSRRRSSGSSRASAASRAGPR